MNETETIQKNKLAERMAELSCELAKACNDKENVFARMFNLTPAEFKCLRLFADNPVLSIKEIAYFMNITPGRITHILTSLESKGFIIRKTDNNDKRNIIVQLTKKSEPFIKNINERHIKIHEDILNKIDPEKQETVVNAMKDVIDALKTWAKNV